MSGGNWFGNLITGAIYGGAQKLSGGTPPPPKGPQVGQRRADGKFYTGRDYGYQSAGAAGRAGLLGTEIIGNDWMDERRKPPEPPVPDAGVDTTRTRPPALVTPPARARAEALTAMAQQYDPNYWESQTGKAMIDLASQRTAPEGKPLADYYRAQSLVGRAANPEIVEGLTMGLEGEQAKAMKAWAENNPMLAFREYSKRFPAGSPTLGGGSPGPLKTTDDAILRVQSAAPELIGSGANSDDVVRAGQAAGLFDPEAMSGIEMAERPVEPAAARQANLEPTTQVAGAQSANDVLRRHLERVGRLGGARNALYES